MAAFFIGILGYASFEFGRYVLLYFKLDDAIEAIPVHLFSGVSGTLAVAFFSAPEAFINQLLVQALGVTVIGFYAFTLTYAFLKLAKIFIALRASEADEIIGTLATKAKNHHSYISLL